MNVWLFMRKEDKSEFGMEQKSAPDVLEGEDILVFVHKVDSGNLFLDDVP